jgi:hypothetical protein
MANAFSKEQLDNLLVGSIDCEARASEEELLEFCTQICGLEIAYCNRVWKEDNTLHKELFNTLKFMNKIPTKGMCKVVSAVFHDMIRVPNVTSRVRLIMSRSKSKAAFTRSVCLFSLRNIEYFAERFAGVDITQRLMRRALWMYETILKV